MGVEISLEAPVAQVLVDGGKVAGVRLDERRGDRGAASSPPMSARACSSTGWSTAPICRATFARRIGRFKAGSGTFRMNVALSELPDFTVPAGQGRAEHHTVAASSSRRRSTTWTGPSPTRSAIGWSKEPIVEMLIPSTVDDSLAPPGQHVASLFCQQFAPVLPDGRSVGRRARGGRRPDHRHGQRARAQLQGLGHRAADPLAARSRAQVRPDRRRHHARPHVARPALGGAPGARPRRSIAGRSRGSTCAARAPIPAAASPARRGTMPRTRSCAIAACRLRSVWSSGAANLASADDRRHLRRSGELSTNEAGWVADWRGLLVQNRPGRAILHGRSVDVGTRQGDWQHLGRRSRIARLLRMDSQ